MRGSILGGICAVGVLLGTPVGADPDAGSWPAAPLPPNLTRPRLLTPPPRPAPGVAIHGTVTVKCRILVTGVLDRCSVVTFDGKPADPAVVKTIQDWVPSARLDPANSDGKPFEIDYVFNFRFH